MSDTTEKKKDAKLVLMVSQNKEDISFVRKHLKKEGFEVLVAEDCDEAYESIQQKNIDLMMIDVTHIKEETESLCNLLHNRKDTASIPVIAITSPDESNYKGDIALNTGADDFLGRPLQMPALIVRTRMLLRLKTLHEDISRRNADLEEVNQELASRNKELEQGLEMAHRLQKTLLPQKYPKIKNTSFYHIYSPADAIGGDIFQIASISENEAVVFLSDVSGHGIRAALVTSILKTLFDHISFKGKNASEILSDLNTRFGNVMGALSPYIYATAFVMIVNGAKRKISIASAGHVCPFLISKYNMSCGKAIPLEKVGPALGFFPRSNYRQHECKLAEGDIVLGFTDGVFEVVNEKMEPYGLDRLHNLLEQNTRLIPRDLIEKILRDTDNFRKNRKRPDDVCMVATEVH